MRRMKGSFPPLVGLWYSHQFDVCLPVLLARGDLQNKTSATDV